MKMINRLIEPTSGRITIDGDDVLGHARGRAAAADRLRHPAGRPLPAPDRRRQRGRRAAPPALARRAHPRPASTSCSTLVGLDPRRYRGRYPAELSGGERQRVGVARALAADPPVMLMDEPFGAVDPIRRDRLQNEFLRLQAQVRKTIVFVTHDVDEAIKMADRIAILQRGGIARPVRHPGRDPRQPGDRVRRALRRRRPRPEAPLARPRARRADDRAHPRARGRGPRRGPPPPGATARSSTSLCSSTIAIDRSAGSTAAISPAAARSPPAPRRPGRPPSSRSRRSATRCRRCSARRCSSGSWCDDRDRVVGLISVDAIGEVLRAPVRGADGELHPVGEAVT